MSKTYAIVNGPRVVTFTSSEAEAAERFAASTPGSKLFVEASPERDAELLSAVNAALLVKAKLNALVEGARVMLTQDYDLYPTGIFKQGEKGTVRSNDSGQITIRLDRFHDGLVEWGNDLIFTPEDPGDDAFYSKLFDLQCPVCEDFCLDVRVDGSKGHQGCCEITVEGKVLVAKEGE